jgi:pentatricopeptide repeat protein
MLLQAFPHEVRLQKDIVTCNAAISACEKSCQWKLAVDLLGQIHEEQLQMTVISYNLLISSCAKGEEWQRGLELLMDLELVRVQSNLITQSVAINACGRGLQWQASLQMLADSATCRSFPNVVVFGTLLNALQNGSLWEQALMTLSMMDAELEPSVAWYEYALLACQGGGRHELAFELLLRSRSTRSAVSFLGGLSVIHNIEPSRIHAACVDVLRASDSLVLTQRDVATAWWSTSILGASNARLRKNLADQAAPMLELGR